MIIKTGYGAYRSLDKYHNDNPGLNSSLANVLKDRFSKLRGIGFDFISLTSWMSSPGFNVEGLKGPEPFFVEAIKQSALLNFQNRQSESILYIYEKQTGSKYNFNRSEYQKRVNRIIVHGENANSGHMLAVGASENRLNKLPNINIPTLVIHGTEDPLIPFDHGKKTHTLINNSKFIALEGVGHEFVKEQYEFIASEIYNHIINIKGEADE